MIAIDGKCVACGDAREVAAFTQTPEQLEALRGELLGSDTRKAGVAAYVIGELARFRLGLCWICGFSRARRLEEAPLDARALDTFANEGGLAP